MVAKLTYYNIEDYQFSFMLYYICFIVSYTQVNERYLQDLVAADGTRPLSKSNNLEQLNNFSPEADAQQKAIAP